MSNKFIALRIKPELESALKKEAEKTDKTTSEIVREILELHFGLDIESRIKRLEKVVFRNET
jgi:predicted DNA-binding protein